MSIQQSLLTVQPSSAVKNANSNCTRASWLDIFKGIGIILVVVGHIYHVGFIRDWIYTFHMPLFFFASGWLYKKRNILEDLKKRFFSLLVPYFSFGIILIMYWYLIERRFREASQGLGDALIGLLLAQYDTLDFNVHLWFLPAIFITGITYNVLMNIFEKRSYISYLLIIAMSVIFIVFDLPGLPWGIDRMFKFIGFYALGHISASRRLIEGIMKKNIIAKVIAAVVIMCGNFILTYFSLTEGVMWYVTAVIGFSSVAIISVLINKNRILELLGRISLIILCIHAPIYRVLIKLFSYAAKLSTDAVRGNMLYAAIIAILTLAICFAAYKIVFRFMPWMIGVKRRNSEG